MSTAHEVTCGPTKLELLSHWLPPNPLPARGWVVTVLAANPPAQDGGPEEAA